MHLKEESKMSLQRYHDELYADENIPVTKELIDTNDY